MTVAPALAVSDLGGAGPDRPLLVLGPSLGTDVGSLWGAAAPLLADRFRVAFDLPGHGDSEPASGFDVPTLAAGVLEAVDRALGPNAGQGGHFHYAGVSVGGAVGLQLVLDAPVRLASVTVLGCGARVGAASAWHDRAAAVRTHGTEVLVDSAPDRWFGPGFAASEPATAAALLAALRRADAESYATVCDALAHFDVRDRLAEVGVPVLAVAGGHDVVSPASDLRHVAEGVQHGRLVVLDTVGHLAPAEQPQAVAVLVADQAAATVDGISTAGVRAAGMRVRREVLGDDHVDQASAGTTAFTAEFQELITTYAWGSVWTRPGLDRRSRSLITLTALVARGHHDELAMHVRAARTNGLSDDEIKELLLQTAIYCGVPDANTAFRIAQQVLADPAPDPDVSQES